MVKEICLTFSLPESAIETLKVILTSESVDEIIRCDHSNETSSTELSHGSIYILPLYKIKFGIDLKFWFYELLGVKGFKKWVHVYNIVNANYYYYYYY